MNTTIKYNGAARQDEFALNMSQFKTDGYFLEFGSQHPTNDNNTYLLESEYNWKGLMFEWEDKYVPLYKKDRSEDTTYIIADATQLDYVDIFSKLKVPKNIDYLQIDLEAGMLTPLTLLEKLNKEVMDTHKFATITFEHDIYCGERNSKYNVGGPWNGWTPYDSNNFYTVRSRSREIFKSRGYFLVFSDVNDSKEYSNPFEDWWVHPDLVDMEYVSKIVELNKDRYCENQVSELTIDGSNILYQL